MPHSLAYSSARSWVRLATATRSTFSDAFAPGITFRLMSAVETIPHRTDASSGIRALLLHQLPVTDRLRHVLGLLAIPGAVLELDCRVRGLSRPFDHGRPAL